MTYNIKTMRHIVRIICNGQKLHDQLQSLKILCALFTCPCLQFHQIQNFYESNVTPKIADTQDNELGDNPSIFKVINSSLLPQKYILRTFD